MDESNNQNIFDIIELGENLLVKHRSEDKNQQTMLYGNLETHNVSIGIAAAITAYARIHMSQFKIILIIFFITLIQIVPILIDR
jgi:hypothetical protein